MSKRRASLCARLVLATMADEALLEAHVTVLTAQLRCHRGIVKQQRQRNERRRLLCREWLGPLRRRQFGLFDQLMVELRMEDPASFRNFLRMPPEMFDQILTRITPRIVKEHTWFRSHFEQGMKLVVTLRHLASGARYMDMRYA